MYYWTAICVRQLRQKILAEKNFDLTQGSKTSQQDGAEAQTGKTLKFPTYFFIFTIVFFFFIVCLCFTFSFYIEFKHELLGIT